MKARILYVEDDLPLSFVTKDNLELHGYDITLCEDGVKALETYKSAEFDICVFDVMLPKMDGFTLAGKIREINKDIPIIFLTAKSTKEDKIHGLKLGGDDYITKPYSIEELILRIEVFLKRNRILTDDMTNQPEEFEIGEYRINMAELTLTHGDKTKNITHKEAELFRHFYTNRNNVLKREDILKTLWGDDDYFKGRSLDVFISRLRKYLKDDSNVKIENIHGVGFRLRTG